MRGAGLSRKDSTKGRTNLASKVAQSALPQLTINSLILLGFNSDEYISLFSGIAFDLMPLEPTSFDRGNERMLMVVLHYLLIILDEEAFSTAIQPFWPCLDVLEKRKFHKAIVESMGRLVAKKVLPADIVSSNLASLLSRAEGLPVWSLLKTVSDACLEIMIARFEDIEQPDLSWAGIDPSADPTPKYTTNSAWTISDLMVSIRSEFDRLKSMVLDMEMEERERVEYLRELDSRLKEAEAMSKQYEHDLRAQHLNDEHKLMSSHAKIKRQKIAEKLEAQVSLLQAFLDTQLMNKVFEHLEDMNDDNNNNGESSHNLSFHDDGSLSGHSTPKGPGLQRSLSRFQSMRNVDGQNRGTANGGGPVVLQDLEKHQANLSTVLESLVTKIDEVTTFF